MKRRTPGTAEDRNPQIVPEKEQRPHEGNHDPAEMPVRIQNRNTERNPHQGNEKNEQQRIPRSGHFHVESKFCLFPPNSLRNSRKQVLQNSQRADAGAVNPAEKERKNGPQREYSRTCPENRGNHLEMGEQMPGSGRKPLLRSSGTVNRKQIGPPEKKRTHRKEKKRSEEDSQNFKQGHV